MTNSYGNFKDRVYALVSQIPTKRVMTYGQIAYLCGTPGAARIVGGIAHRGDQSLPWHRVVRKDGRLATGYPGGADGQKKQLEYEGVDVGNDYRVDVISLLWQPGRENINAQE